MIVFSDLAVEPSVFTYKIRAVNKGVYTLPPVQAEAMYQPQPSRLTRRAGSWSWSRKPPAARGPLPLDPARGVSRPRTPAKPVVQRPEAVFDIPSGVTAWDV